MERFILSNSKYVSSQILREETEKRAPKRIRESKVVSGSRYGVDFEGSRAPRTK